MDADSQIIWATLGANIDSANIRIEQCFVVNACLFHARDHTRGAEVTKSGVINLDMSYPAETSALTMLAVRRTKLTTSGFIQVADLRSIGYTQVVKVLI